MKKTITKHGYTLIELLVAMSIFVVVIMIVFGLLSTAIRGQRRVIALQNMQENARFLLEFMAKEIRMSKINNTSNGLSASLNIIRSDGNNVVYNFSDNRVFRNGMVISAEEVNVTGSFYIEGKINNDNLQPKTIISIKVQGAGSGPEEKPFINVQTTLSQRFLDL